MSSGCVSRLVSVNRSGTGGIFTAVFRVDDSYCWLNIHGSMGHGIVPALDMFLLGL